MHLSIVPVFVHFQRNFPNVVVLQLGIAFERKYLPFLKVKQKSTHLIVATFIVSILFKSIPGIIYQQVVPLLCLYTSGKFQCMVSNFQDARHAAEGEIYTKLNQKIDEFIQLADYEWGMSESDGRASGYLMDLINFLRSTFQVFTHLPVSSTPSY